MSINYDPRNPSDADPASPGGNLFQANEPCTAPAFDQMSITGGISVRAPTGSTGP